MNVNRTPSQGQACQDVDAAARTFATASRPRQEILTASSAPILVVAAAVVGEEHALDAARTITAWATGFLGMELSAAFQLGGYVDEAFEFGAAWLSHSLPGSAS